MPLEDVKERNKALENAVGQIEKQFGKGSIMRLGQKRRHPARRRHLDRIDQHRLTRSASAACPAAAWRRSSDRNPPARPRWRCR